SAIPYITAAVTMVLVGRHADKTRERRWHVAIPAICGAVGLTLSTVFGHQMAFALLALALGTAGITTTLPNFWALPTAFLSGTAAAAGIALVNSFGNLAGFVAPYLVGWLKDQTSSTNAGMYMLSGILVVGAALVLALPAKLVNK